MDWLHSRFLNTAFVQEYFQVVCMCLMCPPFDSAVYSIKIDVTLTQLGVTLRHTSSVSDYSVH